MIKDEAALCVLDPTYNVNTIVNDESSSIIKHIHIPPIANSLFDVE